MEFREEVKKDIESIYRLNCDAFESDAEARLVNLLRDANKLVLSMVAIYDQMVVGHIAFSQMKIQNQQGRKLVGLAPMAVAKSLQKKGIGSTLIRKSEVWLKDKGYDAIFVLGHKDYYPKLGYKPSFSDYGIKSKYEVEDEYFMAKVLSEKGLDGLDGTIYYESEFDSL